MSVTLCVVAATVSAIRMQAPIVDGALQHHYRSLCVRTGPGSGTLTPSQQARANAVLVSKAGTLSRTDVIMSQGQKACLPTVRLSAHQKLMTPLRESARPCLQVFALAYEDKAGTLETSK